MIIPCKNSRNLATLLDNKINIMPMLRLKGIEVFDSTLDKIEENLGIGVYELCEILEQSAEEKLQELIADAKK